MEREADRDTSDLATDVSFPPDETIVEVNADWSIEAIGDDDSDALGSEDQLGRLIDTLKSRCEGTRIETEVIRRNDDEGIPRAISIRFPAGRSQRVFTTGSVECLSQLTDSQFDKCKFIDGYEAIWSRDLKFIECLLSVTSRSALRRIMSRIIGDGEENSPANERFQIPTPEGGPDIFIGSPSKDFAAILELDHPFITFVVRSDRLSGRRDPRMVLRLEGLQINMHETAKMVLEKLGNSVLFQLDLLTDLPIFLSESRDQRSIRIRRRPAKESTIKPPSMEYDQEALSLYWYARSSVNLPLLRFLAYYQVLEFYFPVYMEIEAQRMVRNMVKDPLFNPNSDTDISRILATVRNSLGPRGVGDERSQLRASITSCVTAQDVRDFISQDKERQDFLSSKLGDKLSRQKISIGRSDTDMLSDIAERIYEIRCRIVHTKGEVSADLLLPNSPEVRYLAHDISLLEFLARKFIVAGSRPLQLPAH